MKSRLLLAPFLLVLPTSLHAEVVESSPSGFTTSETLVVPATPQQVWEAIVKPAQWWNPEHSWSADAANLALDARAGGCFCERLPGGGSVQHMQVIHAAPGSLLRMTGALGPLQSEALTGTLSITLTAAESGTSIEWTYVVGGHARFPFEQVAPAVDGVMSEQLHRLADSLSGAAG